MKKSLLIVLVCVLGLSLLLTACGSGGGGGGSGTPISGGDGAGGGGGTHGGGGPTSMVTLKNTNDFVICQAFISPAGKDVWGSNIFNPTETVAVGASLTLTRIASGNYDLKVVSCDGTKEAKMPFTMP